MKCPFCGHLEDKVVDSREGKDGLVIRRRRECLGCARRFTSYERIDEIPYMVVKKDGTREPYDRNKVLSGLRKACEKRPVSPAALEAVADEPSTVTIKQLRQMLQTMLADRFGLKFHRETKNIKGYALIVAEHGMKLNEVSDGYESPRAVYDQNLQRMIKGTSGLNELAMLILPGAVVADKTGLMGNYNYKFIASLPPPPPPPPPGIGVAGPGGPGGNGGLQPPYDPASALSALLEDQLGLRLKAETVTVEAFVIDRVDRPSPN